MERGSVIDAQEERHSFCEDAEGNCTMNYCDENGCSDRKRNAVELPTDPEWEAYKEMCEDPDSDIDDELTDWYGEFVEFWQPLPSPPIEGSRAR